jgi:hypothetical protein
MRFQAMRLTCSSVVEVLVDELRSDSQPLCHLRVIGIQRKRTSLEDFAMSLKAGGGRIAAIFFAT